MAYPYGLGGSLLPQPNLPQNATLIGGSSKSGNEPNPIGDAKSQVFTDLYKQVLQAISQAPLPSMLPTFDPTALYDAHTQTMSGYWDSLNQQQAQMRALLDPNQFYDQEQRLLNQAKAKPSNMAVYNYGFGT